jgi:hypothetical protein
VQPLLLLCWNILILAVPTNVEWRIVPLAESNNGESRIIRHSSFVVRHSNNPQSTERGKNMNRGYSFIVMFVLQIFMGVHSAKAQQGSPTNPILFVTQVPIPDDFTTIGSVFGNHRGTISSAGRGGDLYIRYPDGTLKNLTAAAGYETSGFQGDKGIAVREPHVHWSGSFAHQGRPQDGRALHSRKYP